MMQEENEICPYISRMGVCLEPSACNLKHKTMNLKAAEFVPGGGAEIPEWTPDTGAQLNLPDSMQNSGLEFNIVQDEEFGVDLMMVENRKGCECCKGLVNACGGEACANLGICFCMVVDEEDVALM